MTFPQAIASQEVIEGNEFFRLFTEIESGGDIYELDTSALAFVIGPQSDLARVRVTYFDPSAPNQVSSFVVSVDDPFIGRVDAFGNRTYPISKTPARILVSPEDLYDPTILSGTIVAPPNLDLLCYLAPPPNVPSKRADYIMAGRLTVPDDGGGTGTARLLLPFYRRKYAAIDLGNFSANTYDFTISGLSFTTDSDVYSKSLIVSNITGNTTKVFEIKASVNSLWDYLQVSIDGNALDSSTTQNCLKYRITFTDEEV